MNQINVPLLRSHPIPSFASDAWALGVTGYYVLTKRLPVWAENDSGLKDQMVQFTSGRQSEVMREHGFPSTPGEMKELTLGFLTVDREARLRIEDVGTDEKNWLNAS